MNASNATDRRSWTVSELARSARSRLNNRPEADLLLAFVLGKSRAWLIAHADDMVPETTVRQFSTLISRREAGEPIAYLTGLREFYGRDFIVTPDVLIPRPETEGLVDLALGLALPNCARVLDLGTGSGCIGLTLAAERPSWRITATDISGNALKVARNNRNQLGLDAVELRLGDLYGAIGNRCFDLIVSNPPYVDAADEHLNSGDLRFEPAQALTPGRNGLTIIRQIISGVGIHLDPGGWLCLEHGHDQASAVRELMQSARMQGILSIKDLAGIERITCAQRPA